MSNPTHTPEPWRHDRAAIFSSKGAIIADLGTKLPVFNDVLWPSLNEQLANAARIVACVNALAGIKNPERFIGNVGGLIQALKGVGGTEAQEALYQWDEARKDT